MITNPDAAADRLITYLPVFARGDYTEMIAAIDTRARAQVAEQFAARFAYLAQRLSELRDLRTTPYPITLADLAALADESAAGAAELCRRARRDEPDIFEEPQTAAGKTQPAAYYLDAANYQDSIA